MVEAPRTPVVFLLGNPEDQPRRDAQRDQRLRLVDQRVDRALPDTRQALERVDDAVAGTDEERHHEVAEVEPRLAHEGAQARGPAQTPQPSRGEASCAHGFGSCCGTNAESVLRALRRNRTRSELMPTIYAFRFAPRARRAPPDRRARARWGRPADPH